jgi:CRISPR system Cascade subunit CasE
MKFLSRIAVDRQTAAQRRFMDSYAWHQALWKAFPEATTRQFLFRVEEAAAGFQLFLLSETEPFPQEWGRWESKEIAPAFLEHAHYRFQLRANPTRRYVNDRNGNRFEKSKRFVVADPTQLADWMRTKAEKGGFALNDGPMQISPPINQPFYKNGKRGNHKRVDFEGVLSVADRELFKATFNNGIGTAKAFGFGLLVLQPIN